MAKNKMRVCPACGKEKSFRIDCLTCGCKGTNPNLSEIRQADIREHLADDTRLVETVRNQFKDVEVKIDRPQSEFPELIVHVPDSWKEVQLAPLYDVHIGNHHHDRERFSRHLKWLKNTPNVLTWNGGDMIENASKLSVGAGVYEQDYDPQNQLAKALKELAGIRHKMLFSLPGNHEDRTDILGVRVGQWLSWMLDVPYFSDYCFCTIKWRGNNFRILAHHGSGAAQTAGAQTMSARRDLPWAKVFDILWSGHLHQPRVDFLFQTDFNQATGRAYERNGLVIISPSYLKYFGSYAAKKRFAPGVRGMSVLTLQADGRIDTSIHANGQRL